MRFSVWFLLTLVVACSSITAEEWAASRAGIWKMTWTSAGVPSWVLQSKPGDHITIHGGTTPPDTPDPPQPPQDLTARVTAAVRQINDLPTARTLRTLYATAVLSLERGGNASQVHVVLEIGQRMTLDTNAERQRWKPFRDIYSQAFREPVPVNTISPKIKQIHAGIAAAIPASESDVRLSQSHYTETLVSGRPGITKLSQQILGR